MLEMVTCTRDSRSGLEIRNWLEMCSSILKTLPLNHAAGKETNTLCPPPSPPPLNPSAQVEAHEKKL